MTEVPSKTINSVQIIWLLIGAMATVIVILVTGAWTYQQGQLTAVTAMAAQDSNRLTALEVEVKQLQDNYTLINSKLDEIASRQLATIPTTQGVPTH